MKVTCGEIHRFGRPPLLLLFVGRVPVGYSRVHTAQQQLEVRHTSFGCVCYFRRCCVGVHSYEAGGPRASDARAGPSVVAAAAVY